jgi:chemotaxis signal transduction protein
LEQPPEPSVEQQLEQLRADFDRAFTEPTDTLGSAQESMLAITVAGQRMAVRTNELSGFQLSRRIMPLPHQLPHLLGVSGIRGRVVPVFDLARLLNSDPKEEQLRWVAVCGGDQPLGLAFAVFEGHLRASREDIHQVVEGNQNRCLPETIWTGGVLRFVLKIPSVLDELHQRNGTELKKG